VKVKILPTALEDLDRGRRFYARQKRSLGDYFLDALFSDIDSLELYAGIHMKVFDFHRLLAKRFSLRCVLQGRRGDLHRVSGARLQARAGENHGRIEVRSARVLRLCADRVDFLMIGFDLSEDTYCQIYCQKRGEEGSTGDG
jgi:hypothetical protein